MALASGWDSKLSGLGGTNFVVLCNWLGMTRDEAYAALNLLASVLRVTNPKEAHSNKLEPFHNSFIDYVSDFTRSRFSPNIQREAQQLKIQCASRILNEASDGVDFGDVDYRIFCGTMRPGPGTAEQISLTWLIDEGVRWDDNQTRLLMYKVAVGEVVDDMRRKTSTFQSELCVRLLTTQFEDYDSNFPFSQLRDLVFVSSP